MGKLIDLLKGLLGGNLSDTLTKATGSQANVGTPSQSYRSQGYSSQNYGSQESRAQEYRPQPKKERRTDAESAQFSASQAGSAQFVKPNTTASAPFSKPQPAASQPGSAQVKPSFSNKKQKA